MKEITKTSEKTEEPQNVHLEIDVAKNKSTRVKSLEKMLPSQSETEEQNKNILIRQRKEESDVEVVKQQKNLSKRSEETPSREKIEESSKLLSSTVSLEVQSQKDGRKDTKPNSKS